MMVKKILLAIVLLIAGILIAAAFQPDTFRVERSVTIKAPAEKIFPYLNDFKSMAEWSPWEKVDPKVKRSYSGAESGVGAKYAWEGNKDIGKGNITIIESVPVSKITYDIEFLEPMQAKDQYGFVLAAQADGSTKVTQAMWGPMTFISKLFSLFMSMDKMIGSKYEEGLATLKALAEK